MKIKAVKRALIGVPTGVTISAVILIFISLASGKGAYYAAAPQLISDMGSEISAVIVQTLCSMLYGAAFAGASVVWENEKWSLLRQTAVHFVICSVFTFPIAYFMYWMEHSAGGILSYCAIFLFIYAGIWLSQYLTMKRRINNINRNLVEK